MLKFKVFSKKQRSEPKLKLKPGEIVEVKDQSEIFLTLDESGAYKGLAFTTEMQRYCGKRFKVLRRVNKLIIEGIGGLRRIKDAVILDGAICTGEYHGGCGKSCPLLWREIWLKRINSKDSERFKGQVNIFNVKIPNCQATSLIKATTPIKAWNFWHYFWEINSEEGGGIKSLTKITQLIKFKVSQLIKSSKFQLKGKKRITPVEVLNLKPGEIVEVKSKEDILETLDFKGRNRGLEFMPEMLKFCGKRFRVLKRVGKITVDATGEIVLMPNTVILEGVYCDGTAHKGCQRTCFFLWKEIWLKRVEEKVS
ncbi:MAG: hypothetical protein QW228_04810 [Candidatus Aenigmatarchaeota archaeon]